MQNDENEMLLAEWKEIRESLRYFGNKRFAQLTVFIAATGFMFKTLFEQTGQSLSVLRIMGIILGVLFLIMEIRSVQYIDKFVERGKKIEADLKKIDLIHCRPEKSGFGKVLTGTFATYILYILVIIFWVYSLALK